MSIDPSKITRTTQSTDPVVEKTSLTMKECAGKILAHSESLLSQEATQPSKAPQPTNPESQVSETAVQHVFTPLSESSPEIQKAIEGFQLKVLQTAIQESQIEEQGHDTVPTKSGVDSEKNVQDLKQPEIHETPAAEEKGEIDPQKQAALDKAQGALELIEQEAHRSQLLSIGAYEAADHLPQLSAADYHSAADGLKDLQHHDPIISTTMLQLYEKSAEKSMAAGDIKQAFITRANGAKAVEFSKSHPLNSITEAIAAGVAKQPNSDLGANFSSHDTGVLKGGTFTLRTRNITDENGITEKKDILNFELSHFARANFETNLHALMALSESEWRQVQNFLPQGFSDFQLNVKDEHCYQSKNEAGHFSNESGLSIPSNTYELEFKGVGKITVGADPEFGGLYSEVKVEIASGQPQGVGLTQMQQMLSILGMGPVMGKQRENDAARMLLALIYRTYFPQEALKIERQANFYELSLGDLTEEMINTAENKTVNDVTFREVLEAYTENEQKCKKIEVAPGKEVWTLSDLGEIMQSNGVYGCMCGVTRFEDALSMLKTGLLSSKTRLESDLGSKGGVSKLQDIQTGGSDKIFLRAVNGINSTEDISKFPFSGEVQFLIDINVVNRGALVYAQDQFGATNEHGGQNDEGYSRFGFYQNRANVVSFSEHLGQRYAYDSHPDFSYSDDKANRTKGTQNEVCIGGGQISNSFIKGCIVQTDEIKQKLIAQLQSPENVVTKDGKTIFGVEKDGSHMVMGDRKIPIDEFVVVSNKFKADMWRNAP